MKRTRNSIAAVAAVFVIFGFSISAFPDGGGREYVLVVEMDAKYVLSHGWGHVFRCRIRRVVSGTLGQKEINLNVYLFRKKRPKWGGLLNDYREYKNLRASFIKTGRKCGPPEGFRDNRGVYWMLMNVSGRKGR